MNPLDIFKNFIMGGGNPQDALMKLISGNNTNPMVTNLVNMAKTGKTQDVENFARNMFKEKGRDFDKEFSEFMQNFVKK